LTWIKVSAACAEPIGRELNAERLSRVVTDPEIEMYKLDFKCVSLSEIIDFLRGSRIDFKLFGFARE